MFTATEIKTPRRTVEKDANVLLRKLRAQIDREIHLKIDQDDSPIAYILKEVGKDCIVVHFGQFERVVPLDRIIYFQIDSEVEEKTASF